MKSLSMKEFQTLAQELVEISGHKLGKLTSEVIVQHVLEAVEHDSMRTERARVEVVNWLKHGHSLSSWLGYNKDSELALSLALPDLYALMRTQTQAAAALTAAEDAMRGSNEA